MRIFLLGIFIVSFLFSRNDVTEKVEILGNPYSIIYKSGEFIYARNIWDMQVFNGKLYIGSGNSNNFGPAPNAGRVPIISYNPISDKFTTEYTVAEEQVDCFRILDDKLYIPGHDATQKWDFGNFYTRTKEGKWNKYRTIPNALHVYDITKYNNKLFVALGLNTVSAVGLSGDNGHNWNIQQMGLSYSRVYSFLKVSNNLYACKSFSPKWHRNKYWSKKRKKNYYSVGEYDGIFFKERYDLDSNRLFPNTYLDFKKTKKIIRSESLKNKAIYLGAYIHNNSHQGIPFGAYIATSLEKNKVNIQKVNLPKGYKPWDIIVRYKDVYILCYSLISFRISVMHAHIDNLIDWNELFYFKSISFARSFELLDGDFYFGIGSEIDNYKNWKQDELAPDTGNILRVKKESYITQ
ncbi:MAG TPA: hypothetical protein ENK79_02835 [Campylobacterales bacterium]|nr:hypothetical protein [Campylobacterales bacterium]